MRARTPQYVNAGGVAGPPKPERRAMNAFMVDGPIQGWAKLPFENVAGKLKQKWQETAGAKSPNLGTKL